MTTLSAFLKDNKAKFLADVQKDGGKEWVVVMGNEAGDLDSCVSAIAYSYLSLQKPTIGLIQTPRPDLRLRAENLQAFSLTNIPLEDLLTIDDIPVQPHQLQSSYALVDHNSLLPLWNRPDGDVKVTGVIDHHDDEGKHLDASPRHIKTPLGSCASLVAEVFKDRFSATPEPPKDLATLLLTAIYIDTGGLKPKGKAETIDYSSAAFLEVFAGHASEDSLTEGEPAFRSSTAKELSASKHSVAHLSSRDLLRRDYKQYSFATSDNVPISVGLSTVPYGTKAWLAREAEAGTEPGFREALELWAVERQLDVAGVLTTFKSANKGHKRREILVLVGGALSTSPESVYSEEVKSNVQALASALSNGLEARSILELEEQKLKGDFGDVNGVAGDHAHGKERAIGKAILWRQNNTEATRKIIAPALKEVIGGLSGVKSTVASST